MWLGAQLWGQTCMGLKPSLFTAWLISPRLSFVIQKMGSFLYYGPEYFSPPHLSMPFASCFVSPFLTTEN